MCDRFGYSEYNLTNNLYPYYMMEYDGSEQIDSEPMEEWDWDEFLATE